MVIALIIDSPALEVFNESGYEGSEEVSIFLAASVCFPSEYLFRSVASVNECNYLGSVSGTPLCEEVSYFKILNAVTDG